MTDQQFLDIAREVLLSTPRPYSLEHAYELIEQRVTSGEKSPHASESSSPDVTKAESHA